MAGIETYVRRIVPELLALRPNTRFSLFVSRPGAAALADEPWVADVDVVTHPLLGVRYLTALSEMTLLGRLAAVRRLDVLNSVALTGPLGGPFAHVVTVGDMTWKIDPSSVNRVTGLIWRTSVPAIARRSDRVLTYSEAAKRDIVTLLGIAAERVDAVPLGPGAGEAPEPVPEPEVRSGLDIGAGRIVLAVSGKRPNKNLARLVEAMVQVTRRHPDAVLVLPGAPTRHEDELRSLADRLGVRGSIRFLGFVSAGELEGLYRAAECFVFPSLHEGFGLPVLEAMRRGVPVACSRASSIPEVAGDAALYFDPHDAGDIARRVDELLDDRRLAARLAEAGRSRQALFSWRRTAELTLASFERAWAERYGRRA